MQWFNQLKVGAKLLTAFGIVLALTLFVGALAIVQLGRVNQTSTDMEVNWMPSVRHASALNTATSDFRAAELQHILSTSEQEMAAYEQNIAAITALVERTRADYAKLISTEEERRAYEAFQKNWDEYLAEHKKVIGLSRANQNDEAKALIRGNSQRQFDEASADLETIVNMNIEGGKQASRDGDLLYAASRQLIVVALTAALALGIVLALLIARQLVRQLGGEPGDAAGIAARIAGGDLTVPIQLRNNDSDSMLCAMKTMRDSLAAIVTEVRNSTETIATASAQVAAGSQDLSSRTEEQASSLEETASSMEELTSTVKQNADSARQANTLAETASSIAARGGDVIGEVVDTMARINESANKIVDIIAVIDGIAFQTNILALNAAVEAARAGEQGRGFAVVASEVRNLAQRSALAAKDIKTLIGDSVAKVESGSSLVNTAGTTMSEIVASVGRVREIMVEINLASTEQASGIEQINVAITQMDQVTQQNAALVEEAAAASESMQNQAAKLAEIVSVFKVDGMAQAVLARASAKAGATLAAAHRKSLPAARPAPAAQAKSSARATAAAGDWEEF
ncbi:methyl-accepting chemotaxis protein [Massilia sp. KIM]|uniref:methyl-accepting chemotaxis protein n=1 Tax=Massilia sp. KIM TaxID=1955422 RepID=UPI00098F8BDA|nr:methyl-accepting chemotaxis protein [Massilia sp. KIM]OON64364.1 methyl-accepting chemotaxis protein [Massilia sp. KIM]